jgi:hypothetical protein
LPVKGAHANSSDSLTFNVRSFRSREALSITKSQIQNLGAIPPFSPLLKTARFGRFDKLYRARHVGHGKHVPPEVRSFIRAHSRKMSVPDISEKIVNEFGLVLSYEAVQRWARRGLEEALSQANGPIPA